MIPCIDGWIYYYRCCLLALLLNDFATTYVSAFDSNAAARVTIREIAMYSNINMHTNMNNLAPRSTTSSVVLFSRTNILFGLVEDIFASSDKGTDNDNSKDYNLVDFVDYLEESDVGQDLLDEVTMIQEADTAIVELPVMFAGEIEDNGDNYNDNSFDFERWELHRSPQRYSRLLLGLFSGVTSRRVFPTVLFLVAWTVLVEFYNSVENFYGFPELELPLTPFELAAPVLGLLLVFRSNTAFERFNVGSNATWEITCRFRSIIRQLLSFSSVPGRFTAEERAAAYELVDACEVLHSWILCDYLRSSNTSQNVQKSSAKQAKILQKALVLRYDDTIKLLTTKASQTTKQKNDDGSSSRTSNTPRRQPLRQTPSGLINTVSMGIFSRMPSLDPQESVMMEEQFAEIILSLGTCEKLIRTPIPLGYTRYSVRFLMIWLTLLPFALVREFSGFSADTWWDGRAQPNLVISMLFLSTVFLSIEDISVQLEEPFCVLPLDLHAKWLKKDYLQMKRTSRLVDGLAIKRGQHQHQQQHQQESTEKKKGRKRLRLRNWIRQGIDFNSDKNKE